MTKIKRKQYAKAVLTNLHALRQRRYVGDLDASDTLIDFEKAVELARLTARQTEAIRLVYGEDLTQKQAGERMGTSRDAVAKLIERAVEAIYDKTPYIFEEAGEMGKPYKVFNIRATDDVAIEMEEMKRVPSVIFGKVPENAKIKIIPNSTTARWTNLQLLERSFDGTVTLINMSNPDNFRDFIEGYSDGSYTEFSTTADGELVQEIKCNSVDFNYEVQDVPYFIRKGDVIARAEVYID